MSDKTGTITEGNMRVEDVLTLIPHAYPTEEILANMMEVLSDDNATAQAIRSYAPKPSHLYTASSFPILFQCKEVFCCYFEGKGTYILGAYEFICDHCDEELRKMIIEQSLLRKSCSCISSQ